LPRVPCGAWGTVRLGYQACRKPTDQRRRPS